MAERQAKLLKVFVGQIVEYGDIDGIVGKTLRVLAEVELRKPVRNPLHCGHTSCVGGKISGRTRQAKRRSTEMCPVSSKEARRDQRRRDRQKHPDVHCNPPVFERAKRDFAR